MGEWKTYRLGEICKNVCSGGTPKSTEPSYYGGNIPWLNTKEVNFCRIDKTEKIITDSGFQNSSTKWIEKNSVIVAMYGATAAKVAVNMIPLTTNQACCNLTIDPNLADFRFVYFYLCYKYTSLAALANGGAQQNLNAQRIKDFDITLPPLEEQKRIADILWSLDDKIELNRRINANLEEQAQALFRSWFVDFEPFRDGSFVDSELGKIPQGWKVGTFQDIISITSGKRPPLTIDKCTAEAYIPVYGAASIQAYTTSFLRNEDLLLIGRVGTLGIVQKVTGLSWPSDNTLIITSPFYEYSYQILKAIDFNNFNRGSTQPLITQADIKNQTLLLPPNEVLYQYEKIAINMFSLNKKNNAEFKTLSALRDTLLPKLMAGEIAIE
mgnify:CR=1 FL=1